MTADSIDLANSYCIAAASCAEYGSFSTYKVAVCSVLPGWNYDISRHLHKDLGELSDRLSETRSKIWKYRRLGLHTCTCVLRNEFTLYTRTSYNTVRSRKEDGNHATFHPFQLSYLTHTFSLVWF